MEYSAAAAAALIRSARDSMAVAVAAVRLLPALEVPRLYQLPGLLAVRAPSTQVEVAAAAELLALMP
jgi:hypothetical protein